MIHILYRGTSNASGTSSDRPKWFSYEKSLLNILSTIENNPNVKFHLLWDGKYEDNHPRIDKVIEFEGGSDKNSFFYTWHYAKSLELDEKDLVYFLENDYIHVNDWYEKIIDIFETYDIDGYISLYDHLDKYTPDYSDLVSQIYVTKSSHWRTVPSTCGSFVVNKKTLNDDYDVHTSFYSDHDKFIWLGQNRNRIILTPIPSLSTHCVDKFIAPIIDWETINNLNNK
jgi:hypothetical protein